MLVGQPILPDRLHTGLIVLWIMMKREWWWVRGERMSWSWSITSIISLIWYYTRNDIIGIMWALKYENIIRMMKYIFIWTGSTLFRLLWPCFWAISQDLQVLFFVFESSSLLSSSRCLSFAENHFLLMVIVLLYNMINKYSWYFTGDILALLTSSSFTRFFISFHVCDTSYIFIY